MIIDCHMHVRMGADKELDEQYCDWTLEAGDLLGIDVFCVSDLQLTGDLRYEDFHKANERVAAAVARHPDRCKGYCYVNPGDSKALDEITQRVRDEGFIGVKLYNQYFIDEAVVEPVLKVTSEWQVPVLVHAGYLTDAASKARQPRASHAGHFANAAKRFPECMLIEGHIGGGGDWEWALKHLRDAPSVYLDTSGSVIDEWMIDRCVEVIGADRLLFATDMTMEGSVGKVLDAALSETDRQKILGDSFQAILNRRAIP